MYGFFLEKVMVKVAQKESRDIPIESSNDAMGNSDSKDMIERIKERRSQELIIGLCGAIGSGVRRLRETLQFELHRSGYKVEHIRISDLIIKLQPTEIKRNELKKLVGYERYRNLQDLGDKLRKDNKIKNSYSYLAELAIANITLKRNSAFMDVDSNPVLVRTTEKVAYIVDQLKHPDEFFLLKEVYASNFYQIGLLRNIEERKLNLKEEYIEDKEIDELIKRDRKSNSHGQQVDKVLQKSDYFIRNIDVQEELNSSVIRFINLVHGVSHITPTRNEIGLFAAYSASFRSACLSRQVGAAIMDADGNIIATGCNDVPKSGGGLYTVESKNDKRCFNKSGCYNDKHKSILENEINKIVKDYIDEVQCKLPSSIKINDLIDHKTISSLIMEETKAKSIIEYSRAIHAEMDAIVSLARNVNNGSVGKTLYCTTYPCHNCARHIVAAGIKRVVYIEPYEKSLAMELHADAITHSDVSRDENKVLFENFEGVSPERYESFFKYSTKRKDDQGKPIRTIVINSQHMSSLNLDSYVENELRIFKKLQDIIS